MILDNAHLQLQDGYAIKHVGTSDQWTELFNNDTDTGWRFETTFDNLNWYYNNTKALTLSSTVVSEVDTYINNGKSLYLRSADEAENLQLYHNGTDGYIVTGGTNAGDIILDPAGSDLIIDATGPNYAADAGSTDDYAITITGITLKTGMVIYFKANTANTGACTLNLNAVGAVALKMKHYQDPTDNYIEVGSMVQVIYDGTNYQIQTPAAN